MDVQPWSIKTRGVALLPPPNFCHHHTSRHHSQHHQGISSHLEHPTQPTQLQHRKELQLQQTHRPFSPYSSSSPPTACSQSSNAHPLPLLSSTSTRRPLATPWADIHTNTDLTMPFAHNLLQSIRDDETVMPSPPSSPSLMACDPFAVMPTQDDCLHLPSSTASPIVPHPRFIIPSGGSEGIRSVPLPGVRCPKCAKDGKEVWVIPGRACGYCGTACG